MKFRFDSDLVQTDIYAVNQKEAIEKVARMLIHHKYVTQEYPKLVFERELLYPTGLITRGAIIAIPHAADHAVQGNHIAIGILKNPVAFRSMEDMEQSIQVKIIFMLAIGGAHEHLEMLQILMQLFKEENLLKNVCEQKDTIHICEILNSYIQSIQTNR